jgi:hypothetical protein
VSDDFLPEKWTAFYFIFEKRCPHCKVKRICGMYVIYSLTNEVWKEEEPEA